MKDVKTQVFQALIQVLIPNSCIGATVATRLLMTILQQLKSSNRYSMMQSNTSIALR